MPVIRIAAALVLNQRGETLLVRKRGSQIFIQPGGKIELGETAAEALLRELKEELSLELGASALTYMGSLEDAQAVHDPGYSLHAELFRVTIAGDPVPAAEIEEAVWIRRGERPRLPAAPLTEKQILPLFDAMATEPLYPE